MSYRMLFTVSALAVISMGFGHLLFSPASVLATTTTTTVSTVGADGGLFKSTTVTAEALFGLGDAAALMALMCLITLMVSTGLQVDTPVVKYDEASGPPGPQPAALSASVSQSNVFNGGRV